MNKETQNIPELVRKSLKETEHIFLRIINTALIADLSEQERVDYYKSKIIEICERKDNEAKMFWILRGGSDGTTEFNHIYEIVENLNRKFGLDKKSTEREFEMFVFEYVQILRLKFAISALSTKKDKHTFERLFVKPEYSNLIKERLESRGYIKDGKWSSEVDHERGSKSYIIAAFQTLKPIMIIKPKIQLARCFYSEFGVTIGTGKDISEKWAIQHVPGKIYSEDIDSLFSDLL